MFEFKVDAAEIERINNKLKGELVPALQRGVQDLSVQTHAHIVEEVQGKLHSSRQQYLDALSYSQVDENTYLISLNREAWWIEDGIPNGTEMIDWLLRKGPKAKSGPKVSKDGSLYRVIPFQHNKGETQQTPTQNELKEVIRKEMKKRGIPYGPIEKDTQGMPKIGKLHSFNIMDKPLKTKEGVGQGWGEIGKPKVGYTGIPFLQGVTIYQSKVKDKEGKESVQKQIMTFRIVSSKHKGTGRWVHPGYAPQKFLDEAFEWAKKEWDTKILPEVLRSVDV